MESSVRKKQNLKDILQQVVEASNKDDPLPKEVDGLALRQRVNRISQSLRGKHSRGVGTLDL